MSDGTVLPQILGAEVAYRALADYVTPKIQISGFELVFLPPDVVKTIN